MSTLTFFQLACDPGTITARQPATRPRRSMMKSGNLAGVDMPDGIIVSVLPEHDSIRFFSIANSS